MGSSALVLCLRACAIAGFLLVVVACGGPPGSSSFEEVVDFDMHVASGEAPVATGPVLEAGRTYDLRIEGTYSIWGESFWASGACHGTPDPEPAIASPGGANGQVGIDAEFYYAVPNGSALCSEAHPFPSSEFKISLDGGASYFHPDPIGGVTGPSANHAYDYEVVGQGSAILFRRPDSPSDDNYGILRITLRAD